MPLLGAHHILHVSRIRVNSQSRYQTKVSGQPNVPTALANGNRRLGGLQRRPGHFAEEKNFFPLVRIEPRPSSTIPRALSRHFNIIFTIHIVVY